MMLLDAPVMTIFQFINCHLFQETADDAIWCTCYASISTKKLSLISRNCRWCYMMHLHMKLWFLHFSSLTLRKFSLMHPLLSANSYQEKCAGISGSCIHVKLTPYPINMTIAVAKGILTFSQSTNFRLFQNERVCRQQFQIWWKWQKVTSNFFFSHSVFKRLVLQTCKNQGLFGKVLMHHCG